MLDIRYRVPYPVFSAVGVLLQIRDLHCTDLLDTNILLLLKAGYQALLYTLCGSGSTSTVQEKN